MQDGLKSIRLQVDGITCAGCAEDMEKILLEKDGISEASVNSYIPHFLGTMILSRDKISFCCLFVSGINISLS
jgi:hypothetical protein